MSLITQLEQFSITAVDIPINDIYDFKDELSDEYESFTVEKRNGTLHFVSNGGYQTRNSSTIWCIREADKIYGWKDFPKIKIFTSDGQFYKPGDFTYASDNLDYERVVPDFNFRHWKESKIYDYEETCREISEAGKHDFSIDKAGWIGNIDTNVYRVKLLEMGLRYNIHLDIFSSVDKERPKFLSLPDLVKTYSMLIDIEGFGYSGRLKYLLFSKRPLLLADRPNKEYFFEFLKPWVHYIPVNRNLEDLIEKVNWVRANYASALEIAENACKFANEFCTRDAAFKQWDKIITAL